MKHYVPTDMQNLIPLNDDVSIEKSFYDLVCLQARHRLTALNADQVYSAESLLGPGFMHSLVDGFDLFADMCLETMANKGRLPIVAVLRPGQPTAYILN
jgi:hypothetical protein